MHSGGGRRLPALGEVLPRRRGPVGCLPALLTACDGPILQESNAVLWRVDAQSLIAKSRELHTRRKACRLHLAFSLFHFSGPDAYMYEMYFPGICERQNSYVIMSSKSGLCALCMAACTCIRICMRSMPSFKETLPACGSWQTTTMWPGPCEGRSEPTARHIGGWV